MTSPRQASDLLRAHGLRPQKRLGQNFLCDRNTLDRILAAAQIAPQQPVLEIGAGLGALTIALAERAASVTSVEIDHHLEPILREVTEPYPNVHLIFEDFLRLDTEALLQTAFGDAPGAVIANIPYYITTAILEKLIENKTRWTHAVLLVQQEVARRMAAAPNTDACGAMSLYVQYHMEVTSAGEVSPKVFLPSPDVTSEIIALTPILGGRVPVKNPIRMFNLIHAGFGQRRKTLTNALMRAPITFDLGFGMKHRAEIDAVLASVGIEGTRRGETLSLEEYARISDAWPETPD